MSRLWQEDQARRLHEASPALPPALAELAAVSRAIGSDPALASHGGGNTSLKLIETDAFGRRVPVLRIKPSGSDLSAIRPEDFVSLDRSALEALAGREAVGGEELLRALSAARLDPGAPSPSVEALLHAVIDAPVVLHAHAESVLAIAGLPDGAERVGALAGDRVAVAEYAMPGLELARAALAELEARPRARALVFRRHGVFAWGEDARAAARTLERVVAACEDALGPEAQTGTTVSLPSPDVEAAARRAAELAPRLRGALTDPGRQLPRRPVLAWRGEGDLLALLDALGENGEAPGPLTPDHVIHTGFRPLVLRRGGEELDEALEDWRGSYAAYAAPAAPGTPGYDPRPRVVMVPGCGLFGAGDDAGRAAAAAELAGRGLALTERARRLGPFSGPTLAELRELEFWAAEQAKLRQPAAALRGRVAMVTGAAGAIGAGVALALAREGAAVLLSDLVSGPEDDRLARAVARVRSAPGVDGDALASLPCDVTDPRGVDRAFADAATRFGGADLLVLSHGMAEVAPIDTLDPERLGRVFSVNALGSFHVLAGFVRQVRASGRGGDVVLISTKNVPDPGASFSAYSASKAAAHQLARVAALELAGDDVRVNLVSPDAVFGDEEIPSRLWQEVGPGRARSKGIDPGELPEHYRQRNLLRTRVRVEDVARAVLFFARRSTPTTGAVLPVDGGLPGAFPR